MYNQILKPYKMSKINKISGVHNLTDKEQKELIEKVNPYVQGVIFKDDITAEINGKTIKCTYQKKGNHLIINSVSNSGKEASMQTSLLDELIASGEVVQNNNWYTYKGKNYNGKRAIKKAING